jgi:hypothetical protein
MVVSTRESDCRFVQTIVPARSTLNASEHPYPGTTDFHSFLEGIDPLFEH